MREIQKALILSKPGDIIKLGEGVFEFEDGLSLDIIIMSQFLVKE